MRFWHTVKNEKNEVIENYLVNNSKSRLSLELSSKLENGTYTITPTLV